MIDYTHFAKQAEIDIVRSEKLYREGDYGFAIFSAQQSLEKYLKSYLLKKKIIQNPRELGHLAYHAILEKVVMHLKNMSVLDDRFPVVNLFMQSVIRLFENNQKLFEKLNKSEKLQIVFWKVSLLISLNEDEQKIAREFIDDLSKGIEECKVAQSTAYSYILQNSAQIGNIAVNPDDEKEISEIVGKILGPNPQQYDMAELYGRYLSMIKPYLINSGLMSEKGMNVLVEFSNLLFIFSMNDLIEILHAFSHEQISRYPTQINNTTSLVLYDQNKLELGNLIQKIKSKCNNYKTKIEKPE